MKEGKIVLSPFNVSSGFLLNLLSFGSVEFPQDPYTSTMI